MSMFYLNRNKINFLFIGYFIVIFVPFLFGCTLDKTNDPLTNETNQLSISFLSNITVTAANNLILSNSLNTNFYLIDVRTLGEYSTGTISGATNIDYYNDYSNRVLLLNRDRIYLVFCGSGSRSAAATIMMKNIGFRYLYNMTGGITAWKTAGFPVVVP